MKTIVSPDHQYQKIYQQLKNEIDNGGYPIGSKIPSESELCKTYLVSRDTARRALDMLVKSGKIIKRPGRGSFVCAEGDREDFTYDPSNINQPIMGDLLYSFSKEEPIRRNIRD